MKSEEERTTGLSLKRATGVIAVNIICTRHQISKNLFEEIPLY